MQDLLRVQGEQMTSLRADLDVQFKRIAHMQAELDLLPSARARRKTLRASLEPPLAAQNGNGNGRGHR